MKILETQSAQLTNAEVLAHIREVHKQGLRNHQYADVKGSKLRGLRTVTRELEKYCLESGLTTRALATVAPPNTSQPHQRAPVQDRSSTNGAAFNRSAINKKDAANAATPTTLPIRQPAPNPAQPPISHGDERTPLELSLRLPRPLHATPPPVPTHPKRLALDATASLYSTSASIPAHHNTTNALYDPTPALYTSPLPPSTSAADRTKFITEAVAVIRQYPREGKGAGVAAAGRKAARLTRGEMITVLNLRPREVHEFLYIVEEVEGRLGGLGEVERLAGELVGVWEGGGWAGEEKGEVDEDGDGGGDK